MSMITKQELEELLVNKHLVIVTGRPTDKEQRMLYDVLVQYSNYRTYVGQAHIETLFFDNMAPNLRGWFDVNEASILFFKNGLLVHTIKGGKQLITSTNDLYRPIMEKLDIILD